MVDILIEHGASTDVYGGDYDNPLQVASMNGDTAIVRNLLRAGSDVNRKGGKFGTALTAACHPGGAGVVKLLLEHNADPNIQGCWECDNALQAACHMNVSEIILLLLEYGADPNLHGGWYGSALHAAFSLGYEVIIEELLQRGADINYKWGEFQSVLQAAMDSGEEEAVQIALKRGLSPNEKGGWLTYPLLRAITLDSCPDTIVRLLLEAGADPNLEREDGGYIEQAFRTALQHVTSPSKASILLDHGARVNQVSGSLGSALHTAICHSGDQKSSMIKLLLHRGADVNLKGEYCGSPLCFAAQQADLSSAQLLIQEGADLNSVDFGGHSSIHWALCKAQAGEELFDYLLSLGADPLLVDRRGCNGIHYAARACGLRALRKILEREPDINATDAFGWTPLHWAAASTRVSTQVLEALLHKGCKQDMEDKERRTALDLAIQFGNTEAIAVLNHTSNEYFDSSRVVATVATELVEAFCEGCLIVRKPFEESKCYTDTLNRRHQMFVDLRIGTNALTVTTYSISAFDVSSTKMSYTLKAMSGPVSRLQKSEVNNMRNVIKD